VGKNTEFIDVEGSRQQSTLCQCKTNEFEISNEKHQNENTQNDDKTSR